MIKTKKQGGIGVRDYKLTQTTATVDRACQMWEKNGIWSDWMCRKYVKERPINLITQNTGGLIQLKDIAPAERSHQQMHKPWPAILKIVAGKRQWELDQKRNGNLMTGEPEG